MAVTPDSFEVILWDFDGVIIDSNSVREQGFREVLRQYPNQQVQQLIDFHNTNGGWSRYVKFRYFFEKIRNESITEEQVYELAYRFSSIMKKALVDPELLIPKTISFIKELYISGKEMHIVSGSDGNELRDLCQTLKIAKYFASINGSPTPKRELVKNIIEPSDHDHSNFCLIGDSVNDYEAAKDNGITFFGYNNMELTGLDNYLTL